MAPRYAHRRDTNAHILLQASIYSYSIDNILHIENFHPHSTSQTFLGQALDLLVTVSYMCYHTSTSVLSTLSSSRGLTSLRYGISYLEGGFTLRCLQRLSLSKLGYSAMHLVVQPIHQRFVQPGPLVLRSAPLKYPTPTPDRDRTVSRRSEPSSRTALMGEQPNPWDLLQPQDAMSRHRGAKPLRRCELLGVISLLSPG